MAQKSRFREILKELCDGLEEDLVFLPGIIRKPCKWGLVAFALFMSVIVFLLKESSYILISFLMLIMSGIINPCIIDILDLHSVCQIQEIEKRSIF